MAAKPVFRRGAVELTATLGSASREAKTVEEIAGILGALAGQPSGKLFEPLLQKAFKIAGLGLGPGIFAGICRWALEALDDAGPSSFPKQVTVWEPNTGPQRVEYSAAQCRGLLANAFLLNVQDPVAELKATGGRRSGLVDFARLLTSTPVGVAAHKVACLLQYFATAHELEGTEDDLRVVAVERRAASEPESAGVEVFRDWALAAGGSIRFDPEAHVLHGSTMEQVEDADSFVNFANPIFGYGGFIESCTQEEIIQVCCPEFNIGMLHEGTMTPVEVVNVHGVRRFSTYKGYLDGFKFTGPWTGPSRIQAILTIDATTRGHFTEQMVLRDVRKAYLAFRGLGVVSTGKWGCGVFGGLPAHKFAQQLAAAELAGSKLRFSTFGSMDECDEVLAAVCKAKPTAAQLLRAVLDASEEFLYKRCHFAKLLEAALVAPEHGGQ